MRRIFEARSGLETKFIARSVREIEELFGSRIPELPEGPIGSAGDEAFLVDLFPPLRKSLWELIEFIHRGLSEQSADGKAAFAQGRSAAPLDNFEQVLETLLAFIIEQERRLGLMNLFWLAHSKAVAELLQEFFTQPGVKQDIKYQMHPFLQGAHRNAFERIWTRYKHRQGNVLRRNLGVNYNPALINCIIDDQLPLTEVSLARLNFSRILVEKNKRFHLTFREFREVHAVFRERLRDAIRRKDPRVMDLLRRCLPGIRPDAYEEERSIVRLLFNGPVMTYLLADLASQGAAGVDSPVARLERLTRRSWSDLVLDYIDFSQAVKRSEVVDLARQAVGIIGRQQSEADLREWYDEGRLYRFHPDGEIWKLARKITVVFADVRGFTAASEGGVSERELAHHLYAVFDTLAALVERYQGRIDKFTGDGAMITFGFSRVTAQDECNALRTALAIQEMMSELRASGRTGFTMGISVHTGRSQVAHFVVDDWTMDRTVIGRNVNIAGRLSGSGKTQGTAFDEEPATGESRARQTPTDLTRDVWLDEEGTLYNTGIVVSQDTVEEAVKQSRGEPWMRGNIHGYRYFDELLRRNILLEYVGDVRFRGVGRSIAIYRLGVEGGGSTGPVETDWERK